MSSATKLAAYAREAAALPDWRKDIYLSMRGGEVWRLRRRQRLNRGLLLDMFISENAFSDFVAGIYEVLAKLTQLPAFDDVDKVSGFVSRQVLLLPKGDRARFEHQEHMLDQRVLADVFQVAGDDPRLVAVDRLASFMLDVLAEDTASYTGSYARGLAHIWFKLCDAVLNVDDDTAGVRYLWAVADMNARMGLG